MKRKIYYDKWYKLFTKHVIPIMTGFGIYSWYQVFNWNIIASIFFGLWATALTQKLIDKEDYK